MTIHHHIPLAMLLLPYPTPQWSSSVLLIFCMQYGHALIRGISPAQGIMKQRRNREIDKQGEGGMHSYHHHNQNYSFTRSFNFSQVFVALLKHLNTRIKIQHHYMRVSLNSIK